MFQWFVFLVVLLSTRGVCMTRSLCHGNGKRQIHLCLWTYFNDTQQRIPMGLDAILGNHTETSRSTVNNAKTGFSTRVHYTTQQPFHQPEISTNSSAAHTGDDTTGSISTTASASGPDEVIRWTLVIQTDQTALERVLREVGRIKQKTFFKKRWCGGFVKFTNCMEEAVTRCSASLVPACRIVASFREVYGRTICKIDTEAWRNKDPYSCKISDFRSKQPRVQQGRVLLTLAFLNCWWIVFVGEGCPI